MAEQGTLVEHAKRIGWRTLVPTVSVISAVLMSTLLFLYWPYPSVSTSGEPRLSNLDSRGYYSTGDIIRWTTPEVCQPSGVTEVTVGAIQEFSNDEGGTATSDTIVVARTFDVRGFPECVSNNPTSVYVDGNLATGVYRFEVRACVKNPSPRPKCGVFHGPSGVRIVRSTGNETTAPPPTPVP